jgi:hypothetical protein
LQCRVITAQTFGALGWAMLYAIFVNDAMVQGPVSPLFVFERERRFKRKSRRDEVRSARR